MVGLTTDDGGHLAARCTPISQIIIFGRPMCGGCEEIRQAAVVLGMDPDVRNIDFEQDRWLEDYGELPDPERELALDVMAAYAMAETLPVVVLDGEVLGYEAARETLLARSA